MRSFLRSLLLRVCSRRNNQPRETINRYTDEQYKLKGIVEEISRKRKQKDRGKQDPKWWATSHQLDLDDGSRCFLTCCCTQSGNGSGAGSERGSITKKAACVCRAPRGTYLCFSSLQRMARQHEMRTSCHP